VGASRAAGARQLAYLIGMFKTASTELIRLEGAALAIAPMAMVSLEREAVKGAFGL
jgi:hypothetical protein